MHPQSTPFVWPDAASLLHLYAEHGSTKKLAKAMGVNHGSLYVRLKKAGCPMPRTAPLWSAFELEALRAYYAQTPAADFDLGVLASSLGRTYGAVKTRALMLGLTDPHQPSTGREQSGKLAYYADEMRSGTRKQASSDRMAGLHYAHALPEIGYKRSHGGRRPALGGLYMRSSWEANVGHYLNLLKARSQIKDWKYEAVTFHFDAIKRGVRSYTPDFAIWETAQEAEPPDYFIEVKGYAYPRGQTALTRMAKYHPSVRIDIIDREAYRAIARWKDMMPEWEQ